jgi:23S rRNA pseudouridine2457 synthase
MSPRFAHRKTYWVQVERIPDDAALAALERGVTITSGLTRPAVVRRLDPPPLPPRDPPIRFRKSVPDCWLALTITEGKNRQVRKMTAAVGHPTLAAGARGDRRPGPRRSGARARIACSTLMRWPR